MRKCKKILFQTSLRNLLFGKKKNFPVIIRIVFIGYFFFQLIIKKTFIRQKIGLEGENEQDIGKKIRTQKFFTLIY